MHGERTFGGARRLLGAVGDTRGRESDDELRNPLIAAAAVLLVVAIPLLPVLAAGWLIARTIRGVRHRVSWE